MTLSKLAEHMELKTSIIKVIMIQMIFEKSYKLMLNLLHGGKSSKKLKCKKTPNLLPLAVTQKNLRLLQFRNI